MLVVLNTRIRRLRLANQNGRIAAVTNKTVMAPGDCAREVLGVGERTAPLRPGHVISASTDLLLEWSRIGKTDNVELMLVHSSRRCTA